MSMTIDSWLQNLEFLKGTFFSRLEEAGVSPSEKISNISGVWDNIFSQLEAGMKIFTPDDTSFDLSDSATKEAIEAVSMAGTIIGSCLERLEDTADQIDAHHLLERVERRFEELSL